ncbi:MAG: hypothetical protein QCH99_01275 [Candidatus Bathyarchaeota archaeon]|nr:hypothetical protein [Candidatus Bathyarchaeum tardum]
MVENGNPVYFCKKCDRPFSSKEFDESRFCSNCGKFIIKSERKYPKKILQDSISIETEDNSSSILKAYNEILRNFSRSVNVDSFNVVKEVENYRQYWKPEKVNVILLAESHVFTCQQDYNIKLDDSLLENLLPNFPNHFVRFVYCLGYGEDMLLSNTRTEQRNSGTTQYWKIFSSSLAKDEYNLGWNKILKRDTSFRTRLQNKISILKEMKNQGIWLVDASIVDLYGSGKKDPLMIENILRICWEHHISNTITESNPKHVIVIGKSVAKVIGYYLQKNGIAFTVIPQPQARGSSEWQLENYRKYQRICSKYC